ncbi:GNAT family N-acetyltransferase [Ruminococcus flavefaciens]|uniref:GNAT family N-acetyltransferase n=1 Tax=Ruminococcus flavefaciens TaxID=1265 RepID=UPI0026F26C36|nr:GNAT family N-acetyltransferase [Ruminococcus flavefaciens]
MINEEAFPECERNSLDDMYASDTVDRIEILGIYDDNAIVGFFIVCKYESIRYLAYFAVSKDKRFAGIGSQALKLLMERYPDAQIVTEFETPDDSCDNNSLRLRRRDFYLRNGFYETGWYSFYDDTEFTIACSEPFFDKEEFERFTVYLSSIVPDHIPKLYKK